VPHNLKKFGRTKLLEMRFMQKMNYVKFENICNKFWGSSKPPKVHPGSPFNKLS